MEITRNQNGSRMLKYSEEDILQIESDLMAQLKLQPKDISHRKSPLRNAQYLTLHYNEEEYDICFSNHTYAKSENTDKVLLDCRYDSKKSMFVIKASIYKYNSDYILKVIKKIDRAIEAFSDAKEQERIENFIIKTEREDNEEYLNKLGIFCKAKIIGDVVYLKKEYLKRYEIFRSYHLHKWPENFARKYLKEYNIKDSRFNTKLAALSKIMRDISLFIEDDLTWITLKVD